MALLGKGLLAIWNGITEAGEAEFVRWHIREHIPERVGLTGFLRGRRYAALEGHPKYFNFYETETPETLQSPEYRARLNAPTSWTQAVVKEFRDTSRTICEVVSSVGAGEGAWIETVQISGVEDRAAFSRNIVDGLMKDVGNRDGIAAVHLVRAIDGQGASATAESALRKNPDARCEWLLLVEAAEADFLKSLRAGPNADANLRKAAPNAKVERGIYRLQYGLTHAELGRPG